jgi:flagellar basal-body rod protein FlgF
MKSASMVSLSQQQALRKQMEICSNNLVNGSTAGFQKEVLRTTETPHKKPMTHSLSLVKVLEVERISNPGALINTGNPLDVASSSHGYLTVQTPDGPAYTRNGQLTLNNNGELSTSAGNPILGDGNPIQIPLTVKEIHIDPQGNVYGDNERVGRITLSTFENEKSLQRSGDGLFTTEQTPQAVENPNFLQGAIMGSNVNMIEASLEMIEILRSYQASQELVDSENERRRGSIDRIVKVT